MAAPIGTGQLPRGMGRLERYSVGGEWTWRRWGGHLMKRLSTPTGEINESRARQFVRQEAALRSIAPARNRRTSVLFATVANDYREARVTGTGYKPLRAASLKKLHTAHEAFKGFLGGAYRSLKIEDVGGDLLTRFVRHLSERVGASTANSYLDLVSQFLNHAVRKELLAENPLKKTERAYGNGKHRNGEPDDSSIVGYACPKRSEVQAIIEHTPVTMIPTGSRAFNGNDSGRPVYKGINANDYSCLYKALALTGMRIRDARYLTWADVDSTRNVVLIRPGLKNETPWQPKTKSSIRRIPIVPELRKVLLQQRETNRRNRWVFETRRGTQLSTGHPTARFRQICDELGLNKRYVVHSLRKYWASTVAQQGMDAMLMIKIFGHTDYQLILKVYYAQNDDRRLFDEASRIDFGIGSR